MAISGSGCWILVGLNKNQGSGEATGGLRSLGVEEEKETLCFWALGNKPKAGAGLPSPVNLETGLSHLLPNIRVHSKAMYIWSAGVDVFPFQE